MSRRIKPFSRSAAFALAVALLLASSARPAFAETADPSSPATALPVELQLSAENIEHNLDANLLTAYGQVYLRLTGLEARGEKLEANLGRRLVLMPGPVTLATPSNRLTGENLQYAWDRRQGSLEKVETMTQGIRLSSRGADVSPGRVILHNGLVTKCLLPTPEYAFHAREIELDPEQQMVQAKGVTLELFGHRILPLPNMRFSLADTPVGRMSRERLPVPSTGYDSDRGFFVAEEAPFHLSKQAIGLAGAGYGTKEGGRLTLSGLYTPSATTTYRLDVLYREHPPRPGTGATPTAAPPDLDGIFEITTHTPAGRFTLAAEERDDDDRKDLTFLPRVAVAPPAFKLAGLSVTPALEWARIREETSSRETTRSLARLAWSASPRLPGRFTLGLSGAASQAAYGSGEALTSGTVSAVLAHPVTKTIFLQTRYSHAHSAGATPFEFDEPERYQEGELGLAWRAAGNALSLSAVYDLTPGASRTLGRPSALKGSATASTGPWELTSEARYELGAVPYYSTLSLRLVRHLHCFDVSLQAEPLDQEFSLRVVLR